MTATMTNHVDTGWPYWNLMDFTPEGRPDRDTPPQKVQVRISREKLSRQVEAESTRADLRSLRTSCCCSPNPLEDVPVLDNLAGFEAEDVHPAQSLSPGHSCRVCRTTQNTACILGSFNLRSISSPQVDVEHPRVDVRRAASFDFANLIGINVWSARLMCHEKGRANIEVGASLISIGHYPGRAYLPLMKV